MKTKFRKYLILILFLFTTAIGMSSWIIIGNKEVEVAKDPITAGVAYINNEDTVLYTSVEAALRKAESGDVVHVVVNTTNPATIKYDCEIKEGVTLNIPYEKGVIQSTTVNQVVSSGSVTTTEIKKAVETNILKVKNNVTIENHGLIVIGGIISGGSGECNYAGHTSGNYASLVLGENAKINNYGDIICLGYIKEETKNNNSFLEMYENSAANIPFVIRDFRGGSATYGIYNAGKNLSPFNLFELRNIQCKYRVYYGANLYGSANIYAGDQANPSLIYFVGDDNDTNVSFFSIAENGYADVKFDVDSQIGTFELYGGANINSISLDVTINFSFISDTITLATDDVYFPLSWKMHLILNKLPNQNEASYISTTQKFKLMPGGRLIINEGVTLQTPSMNVYSYFNDCGTVPGTDYDLFRDTGTRMDFAPGYFEVNGKFICTSDFGGQIIYGGNNESTDIVINGNKSLTTYEAHSTSSVSLSDTFSIKENYNIISLNTFKTKKQVLIGVSRVTSVNEPTLNINYNNQTTALTSSYVFYASSGEIFSPNLLTNINKATFNDSYYYRDSDLTISDTNRFEVMASSIGDVKTTSVSISGNDSVAVNSITQLTATTGKYTTKFIWKSSDTSVATVDQNGKVKGIKMGSVTITAISNDDEQIEGTKTINVTDPTILLGVTIKATKISGSANTPYDTTITVTTNPTTAVIDLVTWNITDGDGILTLNSKDSSDLIRKYTVAANDSTWSDKTATISVTLKDEKGNSKTSDEITLTATKAESDICFTRGTLITMADGSQKPIEDVTKEDKILSFNHFTGKYESSKIALLVNHGYSEYQVMNLNFNDGSTLKFIGQHGLFDVDKKEYVNVALKNYRDYIGKTYLKYDFINNSNKKVVLDSITISNEYTESYSILSSRNINAVTNNILTMSTGTPGIYNIFALDENYVVDKELMNKDIEKYGLYNYEYWESYISYEVYYNFNFEYLKISIGKGYITEEELIEHIKWFYNLLEKDGGT